MHLTIESLLSVRWHGSRSQPCHQMCPSPSVYCFSAFGVALTQTAWNNDWWLFLMKAHVKGKQKSFLFLKLFPCFIFVFFIVVIFSHIWKESRILCVWVTDILHPGWYISLEVQRVFAIFLTQNIFSVSVLLKNGVWSKIVEIDTVCVCISAMFLFNV